MGGAEKHFFRAVGGRVGRKINVLKIAEKSWE
jgi:hypothetical protein